MSVVMFILRLVNFLGWLLAILAIVLADWSRVRESRAGRSWWPWNSPIFDKRGRAPFKWGLSMALVTELAIIALRGSLY